MKTTKAERLADLIARLKALGFTLPEIQRLRRISSTLHRWAEAECNGEIERDEEDSMMPYRVYEPPFTRDSRYPLVPPMRRRYAIPDRQGGALRMLANIVGARNRRCRKMVLSFHQTDPRGCALYLVRRSDIPKGGTIDSCYNRGTAVCA